MKTEKIISFFPLHAIKIAQIFKLLTKSVAQMGSRFEFVLQSKNCISYSES